MNYKFAHRTNSLKNSFVREILSITNKPEVISFAGGLPDESLFPNETIKQTINKVLEKNDTNIYQYSPTRGFLPLIEELSKRYNAQNISSTPENFLITTGSQQGLDLICKMLLDEKSVVVTEDPTYLAALQLFKTYEATIKSVKINENGIDLQTLEEILKKDDVRFFYTIPTFQNPTGFTCKEEIRQKVAALAKEYNVIIVEDNPYGELRFEGTAPSSYATFLPELTILLGTSSKIAVPDFRLGWLCAPKELCDMCVKLKESSDLQSSYFFQRVLHELFISGTIDKHKENLIKTYKEKRNIFLEALHVNVKEHLHVNIPEGGMFIWANLKDGRDTMELFHEVIKENVAFVPGTVFSPNGEKSNAMRLNFTNPTLKQIEEGVKRMAKVLKV